MLLLIQTACISDEKCPVDRDGILEDDYFGDTEISSSDASESQDLSSARNSAEEEGNFSKY